MIHRSSQFFEKLKTIPNVKYLAPMSNSSWIHNEKYYVYCTSSSFIFESIALSKNVNVMAPISKLLAKYSDNINTYPESSPMLNTNKDNEISMSQLSSIPWCPRIHEMDRTSLQNLVN